MATPFDPRFGRTGGEDSAFFNGLAARGARMIWCREAIVYGPVSDERANLGWILRRRFRHGNLHPINGVRAIDRGDVLATSARGVRQSLAAPHACHERVHRKNDEEIHRRRDQEKRNDRIDEVPQQELAAVDFKLDRRKIRLPDQRRN